MLKQVQFSNTRITFEQRLTNIEQRNMLRLSKKVEYAVLALQYIAGNTGKIVSAKEIAENLNISFEFLSKTLQTLMKRGIISSQQGIRGGYVLVKQPDELTIADVINALEENASVVECFITEDGSQCNRTDNCSIRHPMMTLQKRIENVLNATTIAEMAEIKSLFENHLIEFDKGE